MASGGRVLFLLAIAEQESISHVESVILFLSGMGIERWPLGSSRVQENGSF